MRRWLLIVFVLVPSAEPAESAPAPFPKTDRLRTWDLILVAESEEGSRDARVYLRSALLSREVAQAEPVRQALGHLGGDEDRRRWLRDRLSIDLVTTGVARIRLGSVPANVARAVLGAIVEQVGGPTPTGKALKLARDRKTQAKTILDRIRRQSSDVPPEQREAAVAAMARARLGLAPLKVAQAPRPAR
jgi:hypothetical protein